MTNKEAVEQLKCYHKEDGTVPEEIILAIKALEERLQGEWLPIDAFAVRCSICGGLCFASYFCPHCGADMRGDT